MGDDGGEMLIKIDGDGGLLDAISIAAEKEKETAAAASSSYEYTNQEEANFVTLPAFRLLCLSNPILETFFSSQLPASFKLEPADRGSISGRSIWHDIPSNSSTSSRSQRPSSSSSSSHSSPGLSVFSPPSAQNSPHSTPMKKSMTTVSASSATTLFSSTSTLTPKSSSSTLGRAYSKDVSTGVVGRIGGFLNTFLGDEVKAKVDELADSIGEKLNTKVVKGPLPSFANLSNGDASIGKSNGVMGMDEIRAMEEERREMRRVRELEEKQEEEEHQRKGSGINVHATRESLRKATESVVEGRLAPDEVHPGEHMGGLEDDEDDVIVVEDDLIQLAKT